MIMENPAARVKLEIQRYREARGLSRRELADLVGVTPAAVYQWETKEGKRSRINLCTLCAVADVLQVSTDALLGRIEKGGSRE